MTNENENTNEQIKQAGELAKAPRFADLIKTPEQFDGLSMTIDKLVKDISWSKLNLHLI